MKETREHKGHLVTVAWERDEFMGEPWKESDGHGVVCEYTTREKRPGERILCEDRQFRRYYDVEATMAIALRDGWDAKPYGQGTPGETAARAVEADFQYLAGWCRDEWEWKFRVVKIDGKIHESLGGLDGTDETIQEYTEEAFQEAFAYIDRETAEAFDAACRDVATVGGGL